MENPLLILTSLEWTLDGKLQSASCRRSLKDCFVLYWSRICKAALLLLCRNFRFNHFTATFPNKWQTWALHEYADQTLPVVQDAGLAAGE